MLRGIKRACGTVCVLAGVLLAAPASAYWMSGDAGMSLSVGAGNYLLSQAVLSSAKTSSKAASRPRQTDATQLARADKSGATATAKPVRTTFTPSRGVSGLDALVASYPAADKAQARAQFQQLLAAWPQVAGRLGVPLNDVASGIAALLVGSHMAYHNTSFADEQFKVVTQQMRQVLQEFPQFASLSDTERQKSYEQMVALGMLMAVTQSNLAQRPDAATQAQLRELGKRSLEGFLRVNADRVRVSTAGLRVD